MYGAILVESGIKKSCTMIIHSRSVPRFIGYPVTPYGVLRITLMPYLIAFPSNEKHGGQCPSASTCTRSLGQGSSYIIKLLQLRQKPNQLNRMSISIGGWFLVEYAVSTIELESFIHAFMGATNKLNYGVQKTKKQKQNPNKKRKPKPTTLNYNLPSEKTIN